MADPAKTRRIEMAFVWTDGSWDTAYVDIPADTPDEKLEEVGRKAADAWVDIPRVGGVELAGTFLYNTNDDDFAEDDGGGNGKPVE